MHRLRARNSIGGNLSQRWNATRRALSVMRSGVSVPYWNNAHVLDMVRVCGQLCRIERNRSDSMIRKVLACVNNIGNGGGAQLCVSTQVYSMAMEFSAGRLIRSGSLHILQDMCGGHISTMSYIICFQPYHPWVYVCLWVCTTIRTSVCVCADAC